MVVPPEFLKSLTKRLGVSEGELQVLLDTLEGEDQGRDRAKIRCTAQRPPKTSRRSL